MKDHSVFPFGLPGPHSARSASFLESARQISMALPHSPNFNSVRRYFKKHDVPMERPKHHEESPDGKTRMFEPCLRPKEWMSADQGTRCLDGDEVAIRDLPAGVHGLPLILQFHIGDEERRFSRGHDDFPASRARTRSRIPAKSSPLNGAVGASADSSNQASNSSFTSNDFWPCRLHARKASLTKSAALGLAPARTCSATNASTSSASMICMKKPCMDSIDGSILHLFCLSPQP